jgi:hypothetical protein
VPFSISEANKINLMSMMDWGGGGDKRYKGYGASGAAGSEKQGGQQEDGK